MSRRRGSAARLTAAAAALAVAVVAALLAHDVRAWRDTLGRDALRYSVSHSAQEQWSAETVLPAGASARLLGAAADRRRLSALRFFALADAIQLSEAGISAEEERLLETSENALGQMAQDSDPAVASQAYSLIGVLLFKDSKASYTPDLAAYAASIAAMQNAVRTDGLNERAKADLELLLRQRDADFLKQQQANNQAPNHTGHTVGRGKGVPPINAPEGDY